MASRPRTIALIVAAGAGSRMGGDIPKQFRQVRGQPMLRHSYAALTQHPEIDAVFVAIADGQEADALSALEGLPSPKLVSGGATRRLSVRHGLEAIAAGGGVDQVLIHDAARPFLHADVISRLTDALREAPGAVPALPVVDSLARGEAVLADTVDRENLWRIQTPQAFRFDAILAAHRGWSGDEPTDDARMLMTAGQEVRMVQGDEALAKFTFASDFAGHDMPISTRSGSGFDVHRLVPGEQLWLCGIRIPHHLGLSGHSDADVAMHALTDATLGAMALGDIGDHFPPSDPQWRGASSDRFLAHAMKLARDAGYELANCDVTIICEAPKIGPHKAAMRARLAEIMTVDVASISVKATTTEMLGFTGRGEGIAAQAVATLERRC
ncbi:MAG TPA: bifunctional 2-C-methyl-D-erythritol 4-phosphate cytidylyltransferase/2-C-methyl-D-erythritol 2,4-cyclodiphosphate synthase [Sphingorhabdus sp.]|jgi:2-C-methyl-D-erythritol 4-phosphate cytidylyltransferase/2-C-methyl-D-erythritol 2,4-cyclodiphosphate synthase|nr:bifunctional 2-C-methyl-D-erythritol 4-phosphate cytidylyltransferase/2-C-methyl-D-erythritol 2,4-cyclodiphosphate synthase [Sphingorhabdus sp.]